MEYSLMNVIEDHLVGTGLNCQVLNLNALELNIGAINKLKGLIYIDPTVQEESLTFFLIRQPFVRYVLVINETPISSQFIVGVDNTKHFVVTVNNYYSKRTRTTSGFDYLLKILEKAIIFGSEENLLDGIAKADLFGRPSRDLKVILRGLSEFANYTGNYFYRNSYQNPSEDFFDARNHFLYNLRKGKLTANETKFDRAVLLFNRNNKEDKPLHEIYSSL